MSLLAPTSLVSKRMHGLCSSSGTGSRRRQRKAITFDERYDVVEFDQDTDKED